jgi:hypothetical protein
MTLNEILLQKLADWRPQGEGRHILAATDEGSGWAVAMEVERQDAVGCSIWEITLRRSTAWAHASENRLANWATRIAEQVTGLLEDLQVVEIDVLKQEALLRSAQPRRRDEELSYYELVLKGEREALLRRYRAPQPTGPREQVAFALTHESVAQLVGDLAAE